MPNDDLDRLVSDGGVVYAYGSAMSESRTDAYGYNTRNELTSATKLGGQASVPATPEYAYQYDDIGNRITSTDLGTNRTYTANSLNQYSAITTSDLGLQASSFEPQFDDDGNQTLIQTSTGVWFVTYNGENRPVIWTLRGVSQLCYWKIRVCINEHFPILYNKWRSQDLLEKTFYAYRRRRSETK